MNRVRGFVVATLLAVWSFPASGSARTPSARVPQIEHPSAAAKAAPASATGDAEAARLAGREARSRELEDFRGGSGVYIYVGSGVLLVLVIVLVIVLLA